MESRLGEQNACVDFENGCLELVELLLLVVVVVLVLVVLQVIDVHSIT